MYSNNLSENKIDTDTSIVFTGDIGFDKYMKERWKDDDLLSNEVLDFLGSGNHVLANVEGALYSAERKDIRRPEDQLLHSMDPKIAGFLTKIKADIWCLNNNHIMDAGAEGIQSTLEIARNNNVQTVGAGMNIQEASEPVILSEAGGIGIFAVGYRRGCKPATDTYPGCLLWTEMDIIQKNIDQIKKDNRWCVMVVHGGEEFTSLPSPYVRNRYLKFLEMGADVIVCHHPHVPMNYELFPNKAIFYSLGNFVFDTDYQRAQYNTERGILLKLRFTPENFSFEALGLKICRDSESIVAYDLPDIFTDVDAENYEMLIPLSSKAFLEATKRQQRFLHAEKFADLSEEEWKEHFYEEKRSGRVPGEALDFQIVYPLAMKEEEKQWKNSSKKEVIDYIIRQLEDLIL